MLADSMSNSADIDGVLRVHRDKSLPMTPRQHNGSLGRTPQSKGTLPERPLGDVSPLRFCLQVFQVQPVCLTDATRAQHVKGARLPA